MVAHVTPVHIRRSRPVARQATLEAEVRAAIGDVPLLGDAAVVEALRRSHGVALSPDGLIVDADTVANGRDLASRGFFCDVVPVAGRALWPSSLSENDFPTTIPVSALTATELERSAPRVEAISRAEGLSVAPAARRVGVDGAKKGAL